MKTIEYLSKEIKKLRQFALNQTCLKTKKELSEKIDYINAAILYIELGYSENKLIENIEKLKLKITKIDEAIQLSIKNNKIKNIDNYTKKHQKKHNYDKINDQIKFLNYILE
jgi:hypothetical protein